MKNRLRQYIIVCLVILMPAGNAFAQHIDTSATGSRLRYSSSQVYAPAALVLSGALTSSLFKTDIKYKVARLRNEYLPGFHTQADNYLQYAPVAIAYGLDAFGVKSKTGLPDRTAILAKSELVMLAATNILKYTTRELRPDGSTRNSFPSGHTAEAFLGATFISEEYKGRLKWMPYAAYTLAAGVGALRIANNRHYISDVLAGAGFGILSVKATYWTHRYIWGRHRPRH